MGPTTAPVAEKMQEGPGAVAQQQNMRMPWMMNGPMDARPMYQPPASLIQQTQEIQQEKKEEVKDKQPSKNDIREVTNNMVEVLSKSKDPKHRNCKFLKFLLKLNHGSYTLDE